MAVEGKKKYHPTDFISMSNCMDSDQFGSTPGGQFEAYQTPAELERIAPANEPKIHQWISVIYRLLCRALARAAARFKS